MIHKRGVVGRSYRPMLLITAVLYNLTACGLYSDNPHGFHLEPYVVRVEETPPTSTGEALLEGTRPVLRLSEGQERETFELTAEKVAFDKDRITVRAGTLVVIQFTNRDNVPHNVSFYRDEVAGEPMFKGTLISGPRATTDYTFRAPAEPGIYVFRCDRHPTEMTGELNVAASQ